MNQLKFSLLSLVAAALLIILSFGKKDDRISVTVTFNLLPGTEFQKGILSVDETGQQFEISGTKPFSFPLKKGKYRFRFHSETPYRITYPSKITAKEHTVTITLGKVKPILEEYATEENWLQLLHENKLKFIQFGIAPAYNKEFTEKYRIEVKTEGCVLTPQIAEAAKTNNRMVVGYLDSKFGNGWKNDLKFTPFGLE